MRLQIISDVHAEFHRDGGESFWRSLGSSKGIDVLVIAGDLGLLVDLPTLLRRTCKKYPQVVYVAGNHELYFASRGMLLDLREKLRHELPNLHWLENSVATIDGQRFLGTTLWFPHSDQAVRLRHGLSDFSEIAHFQPFDWFAQAHRWLQAVLRPGDVVVTHHAPSPRSVHPRWAGSALNCYFCVDLEELIHWQPPKLWVHGHMHDNADYQLGPTRIVCNPFGYAGQGPNPAFVERLILDV